MRHDFTYAAALQASQRANWRVEDIIGGTRRLDFERPFMPEALARTAGIPFLDAEERLLLNQIRGHGYLCIFGLVEEFILPFVLDHARPMLATDDARTRALLQFAGEEAKHIDLFRRFKREFDAGFRTRCDVIGPAADIGKAVLAHKPLSVALLILHIEWMTQRHFVDSVRDDQDLDPQFRSLLKHHWMEESQHAMLDTLMVEAIGDGMTRAAIDEAVDGYLALGGLIDQGLQQQTAFDVEALTRASGRRFNEAERGELVRIQHQAQRWTYIGSGITHPNFLASVDKLSPAARVRLEDVAATFM